MNIPIILFNFFCGRGVPDFYNSIRGKLLQSFTQEILFFCEMCFQKSMLKSVILEMKASGKALNSIHQLLNFAFLFQHEISSNAAV